MINYYEFNDITSKRHNVILDKIVSFYKDPNWVIRMIDGNKITITNNVYEEIKLLFE